MNCRSIGMKYQRILERDRPPRPFSHAPYPSAKNSSRRMTKGDHRTFRLVLWILAISSLLLVLSGCQVGFSQEDRSRADRLEVEVKALNENLKAYKADVERLTQALTEIASYFKRLEKELGK